MKHIISLMLLLAIVACNNEIENLELNNQIAEEDMVIIGDSVSTASVNGSGWENLPDNWYQIYGEPYLVTVNRSHTIASPVGQGAVIINYTVKYYCSDRLFGTSYKALVEVDDISTSMQRNTLKYLSWTDNGSLVGPINIRLDVNETHHYVDCRIIGRIRGEASFWENNNNGEHIEYITHNDSFNINNY